MQMIAWWYGFVVHGDGLGLLGDPFRFEGKLAHLVRSVLLSACLGFRFVGSHFHFESEYLRLLRNGLGLHKLFSVASQLTDDRVSFVDLAPRRPD